MAKTILKHGDTKIIKCSCGCEFMCEKSDVDENGNTTCPECGKELPAKV